MKPQEFLSILSTLSSNIDVDFFQNHQNVIDVDDFQKNWRDFFSLSAYERLPKNWFDKVNRIYDLIHNKSFHHLYPGHPMYPVSFYSLEKPPLFLSVHGNLDSLLMNKISVVGSRFPTQKTLEWMDIHLSEIVQKNIVIVSGAARGIDQKSHSISLRHEKPTIAFVPSGLLKVYPKDFQNWMPKIIDSGGAVMSEYAPEQTIHSHHFHQRNRMIAKLGLFLLVCEARRKSGSTMTARLAIENSKTVCVIPGFPADVSSQGCLDLLFQGAFPIRDHQDLYVLYEAEETRTRVTTTASAALFVPYHFEGVDRNDSKKEIRDP